MTARPSAPICAIDVMDRVQWDALVVVFAETHCAGHFLWDEFERVETVYRTVDAQLGRIIDAAGPTATVIAFSPLGMGPNNPTDELADAVLARLTTESHTSSPKQRLVESVRMRIPRTIRMRLPARVRRVSTDARASEFGSRRFWKVPTDLPHTPIRLNVVGREPFGKVVRGSDFAALCAELRREFLALRDPESGRPLVRAVLSRRMRIRETLRKTLPTCTWSGIARSRSSPQPHPGSARCTSNRRHDGRASTATAAGSRRPAPTVPRRVDMQGIGPRPRSDGCTPARRAVQR